MVQLGAVLPCSKKVLGSNTIQVFLYGVGMFSLCMRGFSPAPLAPLLWNLSEICCNLVG